MLIFIRFWLAILLFYYFIYTINWFTRILYEDLEPVFAQLSDGCMKIAWRLEVIEDRVVCSGQSCMNAVCPLLYWRVNTLMFSSSFTTYFSENYVMARSVYTSIDWLMLELVSFVICDRYSVVCVLNLTYGYFLCNTLFNICRVRLYLQEKLLSVYVMLNKISLKKLYIFIFFNMKRENKYVTY